MRLIDADALKPRIIENRDPDWSVVIEPNYEDIVNAPTIDAVPVIRCRECKNYMVDRLWGFSTCGLNGTKRKPSFYCADAERIEHEHGQSD